MQKRESGDKERERKKGKAMREEAVDKEWRWQSSARSTSGEIKVDSAW